MYVIAEVGSNWDPDDFCTALEMVDIAAQTGADAVKFQDFRVDNMDRPQWWKDKCRAWDMNAERIDALACRAELRNIDFSCSVWDRLSVTRSIRHTYPFIKIASSEIGNQKLMLGIDYRIKMSRVFLSVSENSGLAVVPALTWLRERQVTLLHCVAQYPAPAPNTARFEWLKSFGLPVGWSSHVPYPDAIQVARQMKDAGAVVVEAHIRSHDTPEKCPDNGPWSLYPEQFKELAEAVK